MQKDQLSSDIKSRRDFKGCPPKQKRSFVLEILNEKLFVISQFFFIRAQGFVFQVWCVDN